MALQNGGSGQLEEFDRRRDTRVDWALPVELTFSMEQQKKTMPFSPSCAARTHNISVGGISCSGEINDMELVREISSKKRDLYITIGMEEKEADIQTQAGVVWMYNLKGLSAKTKYRLGLSFTGLSAFENQLLTSRLQEMIAERQERSMRERKKIKKVLAQIVKIDMDSFSEESRIRQDLHVDSLMAMETLAVLETIYDIEIDVDRVVDVVTVGDMMRLIEEYLKPEARVL